MKVFAPPGVRADDPPLGAEPFWLWAENIRWVLGFPETIGLFAHLHDTVGEDVMISPTGDDATSYEDRTTLIIGSGDSVALLNWDTGAVQQITIPEAGTTGRWWFDSTGDEIIAGRGDPAGQIVAITRTTGAYVVLPGSPNGATCGGIINGILMLAGNVTSYGTNNPNMLARWSARNTDPVGDGGLQGFEDWIPTDINVSGEDLLEKGSEVIGGGATDLGFVIWTDTHMAVFTPRADSYAFDKDDTVFSHGLLSNGSWVELDGMVWWYDEARDLCVWDGGRPRVIQNPCKRATVGTIDADDLEGVSMSAISRYGEVILTYRGDAGNLRHVVYNYKADAWYSWKIDRLSFIDENAKRPVLAVASDGQIYVHELRVRPPADWLDPINQPGGGIGTSGVNRGPVEPLNFLLSTNNITGNDFVHESLRTMRAVINHALAWADDGPKEDDVFTATVIGYGDNNYESPKFRDDVELGVGQMNASFRVGGKTIRMILHSEGVCTNLRFGMAELESAKGGSR